jgi:AGCS family alanine or glycine:cation symporter
MRKIIWFSALDKPRYIWALRILTVLMVLLGTMVSLPVVWQSADIIMALMAMTNLTAILLSPTVRIIASDYLRQRRLGIQPTFDAARYPDIDQQPRRLGWPRE